MQLDIQNRKLPQVWLVNTDGFAARRSAQNGLFYSGRGVLVGVLGCDGYCGPNNGPSCDSCQKLDDQTIIDKILLNFKYKIRFSDNKSESKSIIQCLRNFFY